MEINQELIKRLKNREIAIDNQGNPNVELLRVILKEAFPSDNSTINGISTYYYTIMKGFNWINGENYKKLPTIPLNDFLEKEQFPKDDFGVIVENNNGKEIINYLVSKGFIKKNYIEGLLQSGYVYGVKTNMIDWTLSKTYYSKTYTLQQLKNLENNMENKEIVDYQILPEFLNSVELLCSIKLATVGIDNFRPDSQIYKILSRNKVLDLWAIPIYKSKEVVIRMGDKFNLTVKDGKVTHSYEDITEFVSKLTQKFDKNYQIGKYGMTIKDITFSKTGCQNVETKLSEWRAVYNELQKQK